MSRMSARSGRRNCGPSIALATALALALMPGTSALASAANTARAAVHPPVASGRVLAAATRVIPATTPKWLKRVNRYRSLAHLPDLTENGTWSHGNELHAKYMVKNNVIEHDEDPNAPFYTAAGRKAAQNSDLTVSAARPPPMSRRWTAGWRVRSTPLASSIRGWRRPAMAATKPATAAGSSAPGWTCCAASAVFPRASHSRSSTRQAPGHLPIRYYGGTEYPDPLTSCSGYSAPSGPGIILQLGHGSVTPHVTAHKLSAHGQNLASCVFDENSYRNAADPYAEYLGRAVLDSRDAIVLMPKRPLHSGVTYHVSITANGTTYTWSFTVA